MMKYNWNLFFYLIRVGLNTESKFNFVFSEIPNWKFIFRIAYQQGVLAIVSDGIGILVSKGLIEEQYRPSSSMNRRLSANIMKMEKVYDDQYSKSNEIADKFKEQGIRTVVLKGIDTAQMYPVPNHRPCGDLDCFLMGNFEKGNSILAEMGAESEESDYKHSHYIYKGFLIENHHYCTPIKGPRRNKLFEKALQEIIFKEPLLPINNTNLLSPSPLFSAVFLTAHSWRHFYMINISVRHICDWAVLLNRHNNDIDWNKFVEIINIRDKNMLVFAKCISYICLYLLDTPLPPIFCNDPVIDSLSKRVLHDIIYKKDTPRYDNLNFFKKKFLILKSSLTGNWKTKEFTDQSNLYNTYRLMFEFLFERNPHL